MDNSEAMVVDPKAANSSVCTENVAAPLAAASVAEGSVSIPTGKEEGLRAQDRAQSMQALEFKQKRYEKRQSRLQLIYLSALATGMLFILASVGLLLQSLDPQSYRGLKYISLFCFLVGGAALSCVPLFKARLRYVDAELVDIEFELDMQTFTPKRDEGRADKLLRMNQHQLRRYHELNLQQNSWVFAVGVLCIVLGMVVVATTFYLVRAPASTDREKVIVAIVGGVGAVLSNFIAAIYLHMHAASAKSMSEFHTTLVTTQQLFLANLIASRIEPDDKRWETLAQISLSMIGQRAAEAKK